ncbi:MAG: DUF262 domain-containing protein [Bacteroidales bacterium]|nr:DUF262 domain-containing protein [Bacteroidales bacterium]
MDSTITLRRYIEKNKTFVVPEYQRGYIWGKQKSNPKDLDSVSYILNTIFTKFANGESIFLQGVTVTETHDSIVLIDGQQRTTFLYILLKMLEYEGRMNIRYEIREESQAFLKGMDAECDAAEKADEEFQDIYYFKKTARLIKARLDATVAPKAEIVEYLLDNIKFLYINIPENQAKKVFTMMNGNRAKMLESEIIKAELLRLVSRPADTPQLADEWELNMLRSRYAREWDRWIHWWNRPDVRKMYKTTSQLGWLLVAAMPGIYATPESVTFESFCKEVFENSRSVKKAKDTFYLLRQIQKRFEDTFANPKRHNMTGAIIRISPDTAKFVKYFFSGETVDDSLLHRYYLCTFLQMTHDMITDKDGKFAESFKDRYNKVLEQLKNPFIYEDQTGGKEVAFHTLFRLNIDEDNRQNKGLGRRFDFSIWDDGLRSLEHIFAKSDVYHFDNESGTLLNGNNQPGEPGESSLVREQIGKINDPTPALDEENSEQRMLTATEHCIGNLVLLYGDDNSTFNASDFQRKKEIFLVGDEKDGRKELFKSRHLLHTVFHFAESQWGAPEIRKYFEITLKEFHNAYKPIIEQLSSASDHGQQD